MNKELIRQAILNNLEEELRLAIHAANEARDLATHEESIAETQYDTVGLEASYLAHGQSMRVAEFQEAIQSYRNLPMAQFDEDTPVRVTALVTVEYQDHTQKQFFIGPMAGGMQLKVAGEDIMLVTPEAPLAKKLLGLYEGDEVLFPDQNEQVVVISVH
ncbi:transcription elongation factor GreAB [Litoribacillus peritrichatus]|uniref:Transcription elongation factor GreAB n=1 Tax=Litoribacillus peritrichatus TaxID=718191 RepID=A0ABP7MPB0_9GAMM